MPGLGRLEPATEVRRFNPGSPAHETRRKPRMQLHAELRSWQAGFQGRDAATIAEGCERKRVT